MLPWCGQKSYSRDNPGNVVLNLEGFSNRKIKNSYILRCDIN
jgi:hypothetical protein